ncbi:protein YebF [Serratia sp. NPDC078593]|uniref:protein YebF n=1 Tax=unclassified Serratia (in: enterobacteria) TaxID=2647522 RepID=UPI0037D7083A
MNQMKSILAVALLAMATSAQAQQVRTAKVAPCTGLQAPDIAAQVKRDFLQNRITRWDADKKQLGTDKPIAWVNPDAIVSKDDVWQLPLTVRGSKLDKIYRVTLNCKSGEISYTAPQ